MPRVCWPTKGDHVTMVKPWRLGGSNAAATSSNGVHATTRALQNAMGCQPELILTWGLLPCVAIERGRGAAGDPGQGRAYCTDTH
jgi:hypothetical protein